MIVFFFDIRVNFYDERHCPLASSQIPQIISSCTASLFLNTEAQRHRGLFSLDFYLWVSESLCSKYSLLYLNTETQSFLLNFRMFFGIAYGEKSYKILQKSYKIPYGLFVW